MCSLSSGWKFRSLRTELKPTVNIRVYFQELLTCTEVTISFGSSDELGTLIYPKDHPSFVEVSCGRPNKDNSQSIEIQGLTKAVIYLYSRNQLGSAEANYVQFDTKPEEPQDRWFQLVIPKYLDVILSGVIGSTFLEADPDYREKPQLDVEIYPILSPELGLDLLPAVCFTHGMRLDSFQKCYRLSTRGNNKQFSFLFQTEFSLGYTHQSRCIGLRLKDTQKMREYATEPGGGNSTKAEKYAHDYYALTLYFRPWQLSASQVFQAGRDKETKALGQNSNKTTCEVEEIQQNLKTWQKFVEQSEVKLKDMRLPTCQELEAFKIVVKKLEDNIKQVKDVTEKEQKKELTKEEKQIAVDIWKSWRRLTDLDGQRIKELFHLVEPDWDEMAILVAANDCMQKDSTHRRDVVLHTMERVLQKLQPYKDTLKYLLGCIRASNIFVDKSEDAQDWLKLLSFHGGSLYSPSVKALMDHWKQDDIETLKQNQLSSSKDGLDRITYQLSHLLYCLNVGAFKKTFVQMTHKRRKIVVITDGELSDLGVLQKDLEGYRKMRAIPGDGFKLFGGWDYKLLQMNAFLNDDQDLPMTKAQEDEQLKKEKNRKELPPPKVDPKKLMQSCRRGAPLALDPTELADQICTYLKIVNNNLDIGGFGEQFEVLDILGKDASVQVGTRSENLWMAHLIVRVDEIGRA